MIEVIQAHKDGRPLQVRDKDGIGVGWTDMVLSPQWNFGLSDYRVKQEPIEIELTYLGLNSRGNNFNFRVVAGKGLRAGEKITVREVL